ncbi:MAG: hypothetical protein K5853_03720 [Lachnospiraceae bacterium]|nr:hypothetical protein [Lachnospiraceae bacterium]
MLVYEIKKELAPVFSGIVPEHVLRMVGKPGYHSLGEIFTTGDEDYPSAFLQYYDGSVKKSHAKEHFFQGPDAGAEKRKK